MNNSERQMSIFDGQQRFKIDKPIRLIELFAGIGAQAKAIERLAAKRGLQFEHYRICEFDRFAVASYNAIHSTKFEISDITQIHAEDLGIVDTDEYCYIMTYSFPCTDLSLAGKQTGMSKGSGTRSGLLWEVERLLDELAGGNLPRVLLMENVPQVIGKKNISDFAQWIAKLDSLGYHSVWKLLNAADFGVPQNRNRCFMVSVLGDYYYEFPQGKPLEKRLKDVLEANVDEKYYLGERALRYITSEKRREKYTQICDKQSEVVPAALTAKGMQNWTGNFLAEKDISSSVRGGAEPALTDTVGILLSNGGKTMKTNKTQIAVTLQARLSKGITGFKHQFDNGALEIAPPENREG